MAIGNIEQNIEDQVYYDPIEQDQSEEGKRIRKRREREERREGRARGEGGEGEREGKGKGKREEGDRMRGWRGHDAKPETFQEKKKREETEDLQSAAIAKLYRNKQ